MLACPSPEVGVILLLLKELYEDKGLRLATDLDLLFFGFSSVEA